jgi:hypothetical protein
MRVYDLPESFSRLLLKRRKRDCCNRVANECSVLGAIQLKTEDKLKELTFESKMRQPARGSSRPRGMTRFCVIGKSPGLVRRQGLFWVARLAVFTLVDACNWLVRMLYEDIA